MEAARDFLVTYLGGHSNAGYHNTSTDSRPFFISFDDGARSVGNKKLVDELTDKLRSDGFSIISGPRMLMYGKEAQQTKLIQTAAHPIPSKAANMIESL